MERAKNRGSGGSSGHSSVKPRKEEGGRRGGRAPGALNQNDRQPPGPQDTNCPGHLTDTDQEPPHRLPEEDKADIGVQNILCSVKPLIMLAGR